MDTNKNASETGRSKGDHSSTPSSSTSSEILIASDDKGSIRYYPRYLVHHGNLR